MKKTLLFLAIMLMGLSVMAQSTYTMITSASDLSAGDKVILVGYDDNGTAYVMSYQKTNNRHAIEIADNGGTITTTVATSASSQTEPFEITIGQSNGAWTFFDALNNGYLCAPGGGNYLKTQAELDAKAEWNLSMDGDGFIPTSNTDAEQNIMRYNVTSTLFGCYKSSSNVTGLVYIFKEGGEPVINPEPSNYPTDFNATLDITRVNLTWTASTGAQLPRGYVVIGSNDGTIVPPVDGVPVEDDTDPADGHVAYNKTSTSVYFDDLTANTTWTFAIFPFTNSGENIDYKTDGAFPTTAVTTQDVQCLFASDFANGLGQFTVFDLAGEQTWTTKTYNGTAYADMNGYASGASHANEDWLISPDVFANGAYNDITITFKNAYKFDGEHIRVYLLNGFDGASDPMEFVIQEITNDFSWSDGNYNWVTTSHGYNTTGMPNVLVAFQYLSTNDAASDWEISDLKVYTGYDAVVENEATTFSLYPNPASNSINVVAESACAIQIMDMAGRMVMNVNAVEGENTINVTELQSGVYFVRMNGAVVKFVKK